MRKISFFILILFACLGCTNQTSNAQKKFKVGLCIVATGRYDTFAKKLIASARPFFCTNHDVTYFVFTDGNMQSEKDVEVIFQKRIGWPHDSLKRFHIYDDHKEKLASMDYLFAIDADMRFEGVVGDEILGSLVGVPRDVGIHITYEKNKQSKAYLSRKKGKHYFAGAFYGGSKKEFFKLVKTLKENVDSDLSFNYIAAWHDESHLNRYFYDHAPTVVLPFSYCFYTESWQHPYERKIVCLDKNLQEFHDENH
jgi:histo-blood group ABO system transferase